MSGAAVAIVPQTAHELDSAWYSASFQLPARPACVLASSFFCSGPTEDRECRARNAEQHQRPADPERAQQRQMREQREGDAGRDDEQHAGHGEERGRC